MDKVIKPKKKQELKITKELTVVSTSKEVLKSKKSKKATKMNKGQKKTRGKKRKRYRGVIQWVFLKKLKKHPRLKKRKV
jgi:hypothetical protein